MMMHCDWCGEQLFEGNGYKLEYAIVCNGCFSVHFRVMLSAAKGKIKLDVLLKEVEFAYLPEKRSDV
jgi:hypothetical protein